MHVMELRLTWVRRDRDDRAALPAVYGLVGALRRSGQVCGDVPVARVCGGYRLFARAPEAESLDPRFHSKEVRAALRELRKQGVRWDHARVVGVDPEATTVCRCRRRTALVLTTHFLTSEPPLRCGDCRGVVPLYRLSGRPKQGDFADVDHWQQRYQTFDLLWIGSGVGERLAYRELSMPDSELSREGRAVRREIEARAGVPTYYHLMRWAGRSERAERRRKCPDCGGEWLLDEPWLGICDFRCDACRLVSNVAFDVKCSWASK